MKKAKEASPNRALKHARESRCWSQLEVADRIGTTAFNVSRWERGITFPGSYFRQQLCAIFEKSPQELNFLEGDNQEDALEPGAVSEETPALAMAVGEDQSEEDGESVSYPIPSSTVSQRAPAIWNIPYRRNIFFTGREEMLQLLHTTLRTADPSLTQVVAISGLGGIGKTQTALEYAYRYRNEYQAVLWARADTRELLVTDFARIAELLSLPESSDQDQSRAVAAVKRWFSQQTGYLLVLDNANDLEMVHHFIPEASSGHVLLTTRAHSTGQLAQRIPVEKLSLDDGVVFLLRRSKLFTSSTQPDTTSAHWSDARFIAETMDGLPLALDQAAAYIEETGCGLAGYIQRYQKRSLSLLRRRGGLIPEHPESLVATWSLSFEKVEQLHPAAAELLQLCAFLHPDAIAEEIFVQGVSELTPNLCLLADDPFEMDAAIEVLITFSLIRRDPDTHTFSLHRLVQTVLREQMQEEVRRAWAERAVQMINCAFPAVSFTTWPECQRCLSHALISAEFIDRFHIELPVAANLLNKTGLYLHERAQYSEAEYLFASALALSEKMQDVDPTLLADSLNNLGLLTHDQGKYARSEALLQRALFIYEQTYGVEHIAVAQCLSNLAENYRVTARFNQMEAHVKQALAIREKALGADHLDVAESLNQLANLYHNQGKYVQAEPLYRRALKIRQRVLGAEHTDVAEILNNLASLYDSQGKYVQAEPLYQQALAFCEKNLGPKHMYTAISLSNLAEVYKVRGRYAEAEQLHQRALEIRQQTLTSDHPHIAKNLNYLADLCIRQQRFAESERLALQALDVWERAVGQKHHYMAIGFDTLARLYRVQGSPDRAEVLAQQALTIFRDALGNDSHLASSLNTLAEIFYDQKEYGQSEELLRQALQIQEEVLGTEHLEVARSCYNLALIYAAQGQDILFAEYLARSLTIRQQILLPEHPDLLAVLELSRKKLVGRSDQQPFSPLEKDSGTINSLS